MKRRTLLFFLLGFIALAVLALVQRQQTPPLETMLLDQMPDLRRVYPDLAVLDIQAIRLRDPNSDREFTLSRAANGTWVVPDSDVSIAANAASNIARTVVLLHYERTQPLEADTNLAEYGFRPNGRLFIEVLLRNDEGHIVAIGDLSGSRRVYYALVDDRPEIYLLERSPVDFLITQLTNPPLT